MTFDQEGGSGSVSPSRISPGRRVVTYSGPLERNRLPALLAEDASSRIGRVAVRQGPVEGNCSEGGLDRPFLCEGSGVVGYSGASVKAGC
jgi:hypothetical protein